MPKPTRYTRPVLRPEYVGFRLSPQERDAVLACRQAHESLSGCARRLLLAAVVLEKKKIR